MIRMLTAVAVAPGHEKVWEEEWRWLAAMVRRCPGFRGATLLRDSTQPQRYLVESEWDGHKQLAQAVRSAELVWLNHNMTTPSIAGPTQVYDEVVEVVNDTIG
jgi:heme-degrading monooxygenase HmoA